MSFSTHQPVTVTLREAMTTVCRDRSWWLLCLGYGGAATTLIGLPLAAGFVMESVDNSRRGFPTPLPPWSDPSTRYLAGLLALLIDITFFVLPAILGALLSFCVGITLVLGARGPDPTLVMLWITLLTALLPIGLFLSSVAPVARLRFADEGRIETALSRDVLHWALRPDVRPTLVRARLISLPAYLPALGLMAMAGGVLRFTFPGQGLLLLAIVWLMMAALVFAHLVVVQIYVATERRLGS
jgi:hypothetical protein